MASLITPQFERYVAEQTIARGTVQFDEFIFANIQGLNENNLAQYLTMPTSAQIVHRQAVSQSGVINENSVVYSVTIGTEVGDFDFNFIGLINKSKNILAVAVQTAPVKKIRNKNAVQGNSITRNILLEFSGAKALTGINVNANTWQIDFTVRLHGLDEKVRLTNRDLYGRAVFFDDSFLVKRKTGNQFTIQPGVAYVEGVRMDLSALYNLTANNLPCSVYADVVHHCTVTGEYQTEIKYLTQSKADYVDTANRQHYVQILADIDRQGNVTDRRLLSPFLGMNPLALDDTTENTKDKRGHTHKLPIASLVKKGIVKLFSGYDSDAEDMAATPKAIKGLKALIDAITRNLGNYIPNSKKSSAVNSNSAETVATSVAVKTAYDKGVEAKTAADNAQRAADDANNNANNRVPKTGDTTLIGELRVQHPQLNAGRWSGFQLAANQGYWRLEANPNSHDANERRFNMVYANGNAQHYLWFPTIGDAGQTVAYQSWVNNLLNNFINGSSYAKSISPNNIQFRWNSNSNLELKIDNTELGYLHNSYKAYVETNVTNGNYGGLNIIRKGTSGNFWARFEALPDRRWKFVTEGGATIYLKNQNGNILLDSDISHDTNGTNKAKVASEFALWELNKKFATVVRKDYSKTIKGTSPSWDSGSSKNISVTGYTAIYPDGRVEQYFYFRNFRIHWFELEQARDGHHRIVEIPIQLWTAMPNKITWIEAHISRTNDTNIFSQRTVGSEASEWTKPIWAFEKQRIIKDRTSIYTQRIAGDTDETVDMFIKVEGY
nr:MAG TPA: Tail fiber protein [Caudoviricetes sp.]